MSKYIIELDDRIKLVTSVGVTENGVVYTTSDYVHNLEELSSDYINEHFSDLLDTAYQKGFKDGREVGIEDGMCESWEAAKKIALMDTETSEKVTGYFGLFRIMENLTPMQAIEKLKAYEDKHSDRIEVGDIVDVYGNLGVVTYTHENGFNVMMYDGSVGYWKQEDLKKTGKHYDIASILEAMRT